MKTAKLHPADWLYGLSFLLYLVGSSLAHIEDGTELSLWLMTFAITFSSATTLLPLVGIRWLRLQPRGSRWGYWIAMLLQVGSWVSFGWAMFFRLGRNLAPFHTLITITTLLWAVWLLVFSYSRHGRSS